MCDLPVNYSWNIQDVMYQLEFKRTLAQERNVWFVSADARGRGTREEALRESRWDAC